MNLSFTENTFLEYVYEYNIFQCTTYLNLCCLEGYIYTLYDLYVRQVAFNIQYILISKQKERYVRQKILADV